jgi:hypothetical protein
MIYVYVVAIVLAVDLVLAVGIGVYLRGAIRKQFAPMLAIKRPPATKVRAPDAAV